MSRLNAVTLLLAAAMLGGCSYFAAQEQLNQADRAYGDIARDGAEEASPYHYHAAGLYLERARRENRSSDFVSAERFANRSLEHSSRAHEAMSSGSAASSGDGWGEAASDDPWGEPVSDDPWGDGAAVDDDPWGEPTQEAPVVEIVPVPEATAEPVEDGSGASFTVTSEDDDVDADDAMDADPEIVVTPEDDPQPGTADLVIEPVE